MLKIFVSKSHMTYSVLYLTFTENDYRIKRLRKSDLIRKVLTTIVEEWIEGKGVRWGEIKEKTEYKDGQIGRHLEELMKFGFIRKVERVYEPTYEGTNAIHFISFRDNDKISHLLHSPLQEMGESCLRGMYECFRKEYLECETISWGTLEGKVRYYQSPPNDYYWVDLIIFLLENQLMPDDPELVQSYVKFWINSFGSSQEVLEKRLLSVYKNLYVYWSNDFEDYFSYNVKIAYSLERLQELYSERKEVRVDWERVEESLEKFRFEYSDTFVPELGLGSDFPLIDLTYYLHFSKDEREKRALLNRVLNKVHLRVKLCGDCPHFNQEYWCRFPLNEDTLPEGSNMNSHLTSMDVSRRLCNLPGAVIATPWMVAESLVGLTRNWRYVTERLTKKNREEISQLVRYLLASNHYQFWRDLNANSSFLLGAPQIILAIDAAEFYPKKLMDIFSITEKKQEFYFKEIERGYMKGTMYKQKMEEVSEGTRIITFSRWENFSEPSSIFSTPIHVLRALLLKKKILLPRIEWI